MDSKHFELNRNNSKNSRKVTPSCIPVSIQNYFKVLDQVGHLNTYGTLGKLGKHEVYIVAIQIEDLYEKLVRSSMQIQFMSLIRIRFALQCPNFNVMVLGESLFAIRY